MKLLLDTHIVLDLLLDRKPYADSAAELFSKVENGTVIGCLSGSTVTTVYYLAAKTVGAARAQEEIRKLLTIFDVAPVNRPVLEAALAADFSDFEDAVIHEAACYVGAEAIITRNQKDFKKSRIPVYTADEITKILVL